MCLQFQRQNVSKFQDRVIMSGQILTGSVEDGLGVFGVLLVDLGYRVQYGDQKCPVEFFVLKIETEFAD